MLSYEIHADSQQLREDNFVEGGVLLRRSSCTLFPLLGFRWTWLSMLSFTLIWPYGSSTLNKDLAETTARSETAASCSWLTDSFLLQICIKIKYATGLFLRHMAHWWRSVWQLLYRTLWVFSYLCPLFTGVERISEAFSLRGNGSHLLTALRAAAHQYQRCGSWTKIRAEKPTQVHHNQPQSAQVNRHYNPALMERLGPAILFTDCVLVMEMCWLHWGSAEEHGKFVEAGGSMFSASHPCRRRQSKNVLDQNSRWA